MAMRPCRAPRQPRRQRRATFSHLGNECKPFAAGDTILPIGLQKDKAVSDGIGGEPPAAAFGEGRTAGGADMARRGEAVAIQLL